MPRSLVRMFNRHHPGDYAGYPFLRMLLPLLLIAGLVAAAAFIAVRYSRRSSATPAAAPTAPGADAAVAHARVRYARGEMSRDDYTQVMADLTGAPLPAPPPPPDAPAAG